MIKVTYTSIRTTIDSPFFIYDEDLKNTVQTEFLETGKIVDVYSTLSEDGLVWKEILVFNTEKDYEDFKNHEAIAYAESVRLAYNIHHRIDIAFENETIS